MGQISNINATSHLGKTGPQASASNFYTIGDLSREFDVSLRALRFYENRDLLHPERRGTTRLYYPADRVRLQIILKGKKLGFTLTEIREMIASHGADDAAELQLAMNPDQVRAQIDHLERQRKDIDTAIGELKATHSRLVGPGNIAAA